MSYRYSTKIGHFLPAHHFRAVAQYVHHGLPSDLVLTVKPRLGQTPPEAGGNERSQRDRRVIHDPRQAPVLRSHAISEETFTPEKDAVDSTDPGKRFNFVQQSTKRWRFCFNFACYSASKIASLCASA
jgi:hypothetical protein